MAYQADRSGVATTAPVVVGLFKDANSAHAAITQLKANGFATDQIGAAFRGETRGFSGDRSVSHEAGSLPQHESWWEKVKDAFRPEEEKTTATPNVEASDYSRGEYEYDVEGNDFEGSLAGAGISTERAAYLTRSLEAGGAIVTVRDAMRSEEAESILAENGARVRTEDADDTNASYADAPYSDVPETYASRAGIAGTVAGTTGPIGGVDPIGVADPVRSTDLFPTTDTETTVGAGTNDVDRGLNRIQLFGEVLRVHKERISRGEIRVHKDVISETQSIEVPVTREEFVLERVPVSGTTPVSSASIGRDQEIRVPLSEETVRLEKQAVVREEVIVGKRDVSDVATVSDNVRHEELRVDDDQTTPRRAVTAEDVAAENVRLRG